MPAYADSEPVDSTFHLIDAIRQSTLNSQATYVALTQFTDLVPESSRSLASLGIAVVTYEPSQHGWKSALTACSQRAFRATSYEFLIFCALPSERNGLVKAKVKLGNLFVHKGLNCQTIEIGGRTGLVIVQPKMGLVDGSVVVARAVELFAPLAVFMVGICAGFKQRVELGTVVIAERAWEHQTGKWQGDAFKLEAYQAPLRNDVKTLIEQEIEKTACFHSTRDTFRSTVDEKFLDAPVVIGPVVSGSAVVSSSLMQEMIADQHKRLVGLDMEVYGMYRAAEMSAAGIVAVSIKCVVDYADEDKNDQYQLIGTVISGAIARDLIPIVLDHISQC